MESSVVIGLQWGDEGKGKIVDYLAPKYDIISRFQGGNNAGHTIMFNGQTYKLSLIPSGIFSKKIAYIGAGVVIDPEVLLKEMEYLKNLNFATENYLKIAENANVILPIHKKLDSFCEESNSVKIGTTKRGIGFAYQDKIARRGIRICDIPNTQGLLDAIKTIAFYAKPFVEVSPEEISETVKNLQNFYNTIQKNLVHPVDFMNENIRKTNLFEGAQGILLDITFGTYPFVTSSNTLPGQIFCGSGFGKSKVTKIYGISKAYSTRVGEGPFPTEDFGELGEKLQSQGNEFGTVTKRKRRCGGLDLVALKYACDVSGVTEIILTKIDVLDSLDKIPVCIAYEQHGTSFPLSTQMQSSIKPVYKTFEGWNTDTTKITEYKNLPQKAKEYIEFIENYLNVKITMVSNGPERNSVIIK